MRLGKETGGCTISYQGKAYAWAKDGAVIQVPAGLGQELLSIRGAGYFEPAEEAGPVTEPAPAKAAVTEPAPAAKAAVAEGPGKGAPAK